MLARISAILAIAAVLAPVQAGAANKLAIGDPAPKIKVAKWLKGAPVDSFARGKTYVVEFWATWCGPCRVSIPHLTKLAHEYAGKVTFIGVDIWERNPSDIASVATFVKGMGDQMQYHVAADGPTKTMTKTWMDVAGADGVPTAFVVGPKGTVVWIGHPMELDGVLKPILAGKWDASAYAKQRTEAMAAQKRQQAAMMKLNALYSQGKYREAVAEVDRLEAAKDLPPEQAAMLRFSLLAKTSEPEAYAYATKLSTGALANQPQMLNAIAWMIVDDKTPLKHPDYSVALSLATKADELSGHKDVGILDTLAAAQFKSGKVADALATQTHAVDLAAKESNLPESVVQEMRDRLQRYQAASKEKSPGS